MMIIYSMKNKKTKYILIGIGLIFVIWLVLSLTFDSVVVPKISDTVLSLISILSKGHSYAVIGLTMLRLLIALTISFLIAIGLSVLAIAVDGAKEIMSPIITVLRSIPIVGIIIVILLIAKVDYASIIITVLVAFPIMYNAILSGMENISKDIKDEVRMVSEINIDVISGVYIPIASPYIITGVLTSTGLGLKVMVMSEFIAAPKYSIAREMASYQLSFDMASIFAWIIIMLIFVFTLEYFIKRIKVKN